MEQEDLMPIRIRRHDVKRQETQVVGTEEIIAARLAVSTACYVGWKRNFRILCGSI